MNKKAALIAALVAIASAAFSSTAIAQPIPPGEGWKKAFYTPQGRQRELYATWVRIVGRRGSVVTYETLSTGEFGYIEKYDYSKVGIGQVNCANGDIRQIGTRQYPRGSSADWYPAMPGTNGQFLVETVCE